MGIADAQHYKTKNILWPMFNEEIEIALCKTAIEIWQGWEQIYPKDDKLVRTQGEEIIYQGILDDEGSDYYRFEEKAVRILPCQLVPVKRSKAKGVNEKEGDPTTKATGFASQVVELNLAEMKEFNQKQISLAILLKPFGKHTLNLKYIQPKNA